MIQTGKYIALILYLLIPVHLAAQFQNKPELIMPKLYLNPAYSGIQNCNILELNYNETFIKRHYSLSGTFNLTKFNSSISVLLSNNEVGNGIISKPYGGFIYSRVFKLNKPAEIRTAASLGIEKPLIHTEKIIYPSGTSGFPASAGNNAPDYSLPGNFVYHSSASALYYSNSIQTGIIFASKYEFDGAEPKLKPLYRFHFGKIVAPEYTKIIYMPVIVLTFKHRILQITTGSYLKTGELYLGAFMNFQQDFNNLKSFLSVSYDFSKFRLSYSYGFDYYISPQKGLSEHRIIVSYKLSCDSKRKAANTIYCRDF